MSDLPNGWAWSSVGELAQYVNGRAFKPVEWKEHGLPIIRIQNLNDPSAKFNFSATKHEEKYLVKRGDLLFAWSASLGAHIWHGDDAWLNQHIFNVLPHPCSIKLFVFYLLKKITAELYAKAHGSGMVHVTKGKFEATGVALPPLNEQHRIVAKIEELFSELEKGVESLKAAREQLKVYRQSVLKAAFEGKLTENWGKAHAIELESASELLARITAEREARYAARLAEWQQSGGFIDGKKSPKPKKPKELPPLTPDEIADLPELPSGWGWVKVGQLAKKITDGEHFRPTVTTSGAYFLSAKDIREEGVSFTNPLYISPETAEKALARCDPERGDILIVSRGATVGRMCIVNCDEIFCLLGSVILIKPEQEASNRFLFYGLKSPFINRKVVSISGATAQQAIYLRDIQHVASPICSLEEQHQIVQEIESRFSVVEKMEQTIEESLQKAESLRQSILKRAFEGKLVPQNPDDEPASELLARIRAERAKVPATGRKKKEAA